ncbi:MAG: 4Fe-4S cluster-binding domain-containing protein [Verrucomicrobia bacterium]|nr:4Fe-4S cluster-binding domain-containing protein [Verrucomicrobiota bacterium]
MNCEILHTLYLRSNGDVPCNDDAGETVLLGLLRPQMTTWSARSLFANHRYAHIRAALSAGQPPWPKACTRCAFFHPHEPYRDFLAEKRIRKFQVEPSLACRLCCPGCSNHVQVRTRTPPLFMDLGLFERVIRNLSEEGYSVGEVEYCGQGEPLLHPEFPAFVRLVRRYFPEVPQRVITSGNFDFHAATGGERLDEVMVSCDGVFPENYVRQRVGGDVSQAIRFMRDASGVTGAGRRLVVWKYILFEWNDSLAELTAAQRLAEEIGVDRLLFVYTHSVGRSLRYLPAADAAFPVRGPRVTTNATPIHYRLSEQPVTPGV